MGPGGGKGEGIDTKINKINSLDSKLVPKRQKTCKLTNAYHSRTLVVDIFGADVAHHAGGHGLK